MLEKWADVKFNMPIVIGTAQQHASETFVYHQHETPTKKVYKSRQNSVVMSRKNSVIKSPITGEEFQYNDDDDPNLPIPCWGIEEDAEKVAVNMMPSAPNEILDNGFAFSSLPPLDLTCKMNSLFVNVRM